MRCQLQHLFDTHFPTTAFPTAVYVPSYVCLVKDAVTTSRRCVASNYRIAVSLDLKRIRMQTLVAYCILLLLHCLEELCKTTKMRTVVSVEVRTEPFLVRSRRSELNVPAALCIVSEPLVCRFLCSHDSPACNLLCNHDPPACNFLCSQDPLACNLFCSQRAIFLQTFVQSASHCPATFCAVSEPIYCQICAVTKPLSCSLLCS